MNWLTLSHNTLFTAAFFIVLCFAALEIICMLLGVGLAQWLDDFLPNTDMAQANADGGMDGELSGSGGGFFQSLFSWLEIGKLPLLVSLNIFLASFSIAGFLIQGVSVAVWGTPLLSLLAGGLAFASALPLLRLGNRLFSKIWPKDESSAVHENAFVGCHGRVTLGTATKDKPAEVKFSGPDGCTHYVMAFATQKDLPQGTPVILVDLHATKPSHFLIAKNSDLKELC